MRSGESPKRVCTETGLPAAQSRCGWIVVALATLVLFFNIGCRKESAPPGSLSSASSAESGKANGTHDAGRADRDVAGELADEAVLQCQQNQFRDRAAVDRAMAMMISLGRFHDCMNFFDDVLAATPDNHTIRRKLFQMAMGTEDRVRAVPHAEYLIRQRQFDVPLMISLSNTEARTEPADPLIEMVRRNPSDHRPMIASARLRLDAGDTESAQQMLEDIIARHPAHAPSLALLGQAMIASGKEDKFGSFAHRATPIAHQYPGFWGAAGDAAASKLGLSDAMRCYWEAVRLDPSHREAWLKFNSAVEQIDAELSGLDDQQRDALGQRVVQLTQFSQRLRTFAKSSQSPNPSPDAAMGIAESLQDLHRSWEAEAWASLAVVMASQDPSLRDEIQQKRNAIVKTLRPDLPWHDDPLFESIDAVMAPKPLPELVSLEQSADASGTNIAGSGDGGSRIGLGRGIQLNDEAAKRGIVFSGHTGDVREPGVMLYQTLGCGGGSLDFDLDGWTDLYLAAAGGTPPAADSPANAMLRNHQGEFTEVTSACGTGDQGFAQGVAVGDVNEDGFPDLLVLNYGPNSLLINNGDGTFTDQRERLDESGPSQWSTSGAIADIDHDGLADAVIVNYCEGLLPVTQDCPHPKLGIKRACSPITFPGSPDQFLQNQRDGSLRDQTTAWGAIPDDTGRGLGLVIGALDSFSGNDVFIANDMSGNHYWNAIKSENDDVRAAFGLTESAILRGLSAGSRSLAQGSMGIAVGDIDRDHDIDLFVTNFVNEPNAYHTQVGPGLWRDQTSAVNLSVPSVPLVGFGTQMIDLNNDGDLEIVVTNGHVDTYPTRDPPTPYAQATQVFGRAASPQDQAENETTSRHGRSRARVFEPWTSAILTSAITSPYLQRPHVGRALWTIDANRDGLMDIVVTHQTEPVALLVTRASTSGHWIKINLVGRQCSRDAIGAVAEIQCEGETWSSPLCAGNGFLCSNQRVIHVGLGDKTSPCQVTLRWPDGDSQVFPDLQVDQTWLLIQGDGEAFPISP